MFRRRDIPPVLLLLLLIILVMLTLSQILVVHNGRYGRNVLSMRKLQLELRQMDVNLHALMMQNVPSIELNRRMLQNEINAHRFADILSQAAQVDPGSEAGGLPARRSRESSPRQREEDHILTRRSGVVVDRPSSRVQGEGVSQSRLDQGAADGIRPMRHSAWDQKPVDSGASSHGEDRPKTVSSNKRTRSEFWPRNGPDKGRSTTRDYHAFHSLYNASLPADFHESFTFLNSSIRTRGSVDNVPSDSSLYRHNRPRNTKRDSVIAYCPSIPPNLKGNVGVDLTNASTLTWDDVARENPELRPGGMWAPSGCVARHKVAIIVPYRDREPHLIALLYYLHPILQRQQLEYRLYVVEQQGKDTFNKARIMNVAFVEALKLQTSQCFVFHDVDLVPEFDTNMYSCPFQPRHMSVAIDEMGYKLAYQELVGGVLNMRTEHFQRVNGYSNLYWGWGAEDDDMAYRMMHVGLKITRPPETTARYKMAKHTKRKPADWRKRAKLLYTGTRRFQFDGLNSLQYNVISIINKPLYTHLLVDIGRPPRGF